MMDKVLYLFDADPNYGEVKSYEAVLPTICRGNWRVIHESRIPGVGPIPRVDAAIVYLRLGVEEYYPGTHVGLPQLVDRIKEINPSAPVIKTYLSSGMEKFPAGKVDHAMLATDLWEQLPKLVCPEIK